MLSQTCIKFFLVLNTKQDILKKVETKQLLLHFDFDRKNKILCKSLRTRNCLVFHILQNIIYVQQKKETHSGLKLNSSE